jgi:cytoskeletal protein RodZ
MQEDFGAYLKAQRELRGISLEEISNETKIPVRHLQALEGNEQDELPDEVFVKGYIKAYADSIGADADEVLSAYDETVLAPIREEAENQRIIEESLNRRKKNTFVGILSVVIIAGLAAAGYLYISNEPLGTQPQKVVSEKKIKKAAVKEVKDTVEVLQDNEILEEDLEKIDDAKSLADEKPDKPEDEPKTDEVASKPAEPKKPLAKKKEEVASEPAEPKKALAKKKEEEVSKPAEPKKTLVKEKKNNNTAETGHKSSEQKKIALASIASENKVEENGAGKPENSVTIQAHKNNGIDKKPESLHLVVKAEQEGWFNLIVDGSTRRDFILPAGSSKSFRAESSIKVWIGNKQGTKLVLNDKALQLPESVDNVIRNFSITAKLLE